MIVASTVTTDLEISETVETTKTYQIAESKIQGYIDELIALEQFIYKLLDTERYEYEIYSLDYGIQLYDLLGKDKAYVESELQRRITEVLAEDDRITSVNNFAFTVSGDELLCTFDVTSIYGMTTISKGVTV